MLITKANKQSSRVSTSTVCLLVLYLDQLSIMKLALMYDIYDIYASNSLSLSLDLLTH